jgi:peptide deformylase
MAVLKILTFPDERLKLVSEPVTGLDEELLKFIKDLEETMRNGPGGVGIAAVQVGRLERVVVMDVSGKQNVKGHGRLVLINPEIVSWEGSAVGREGCLSVPDYTGNVIRAESIHLEAMDEKGRSREYDMEGFEARAAQHELDHLDGLLFLDRLVSRRGDLFKRKVYQKSAKEPADKEDEVKQSD